MTAPTQTPESPARTPDDVRSDPRPGDKAHGDFVTYTVRAVDRFNVLMTARDYADEWEVTAPRSDWSGAGTSVVFVPGGEG